MAMKKIFPDQVKENRRLQEEVQKLMADATDLRDSDIKRAMKYTHRDPEDMAVIDLSEFFGVRQRTVRKAIGQVSNHFRDHKKWHCHWEWPD